MSGYRGYARPPKRGEALRWIITNGRKLLEGNAELDKEAFRLALWQSFPAWLLPDQPALLKYWFDKVTQQALKTLRWNMDEGARGVVITDEIRKTMLEWYEDPGLRLARALYDDKVALVERCRFYLEAHGLQDKFDAEVIVEDLLRRAADDEAA